MSNTVRKNSRSIDYQKILIDSLKDHEPAFVYLDIAIKESLQEDAKSQQLLLMAIKNVTSAGGIVMKYGNYLAYVFFDSEAKVFHGEVLGLKDVITFQGTSVKDFEKAFHDSVDDYLDWCEERGEKPEKAFSGSLCVRISSDLSCKISTRSNDQKPKFK